MKNFLNCSVNLSRFFTICLITIALTTFSASRAEIAQAGPNEADPNLPAAAAAAPPKPATLAGTRSVSSSDLHGFHFALDGLRGTSVEGDLQPDFTSYWNKPIPSPGMARYVSKDQKQMFDWVVRKTESDYEIATMNTETMRGTITVFKDLKPASYTVVGPFGEYTATETFCHLMKKQTNSKTYSEMATKAQSCNAFYKREPLTPVEADYLPEIAKTHRKNINRLKSSVAKRLVTDLEVKESKPNSKPRTATDYVYSGLKSLFSSDAAPGNTTAKSQAGVKQREPRALLANKSNDGDIADRQMIEDLARACENFWAPQEQLPGAAGASKQQTVKK